MPHNRPHDHDHHHPHHRRSNRDRVLEAVDLLRLSRKINSADDLIGCLKEMAASDLVDFLNELQRGLTSGPLDIDTAIAANRAFAVVSARDEHDGLLENCNGRNIGLLFPLPPHVHEQFLDAPNVKLFVAPGHKLPPHLRRRNAINNPREISRCLDQLDVIVFEGFQEDDGPFFVEAGVAAILDMRLIPVATKLLVHLRPHQHDDDDEFDLGGRPVSFL